MTLSVIIVSYNALEDLERCLESLHRSPPAVRHDITVVDNASTEGGLDTLRSRWPGVQIIALDRNRGFAAGNNAGIRATRGELLLLLNSDTVVQSGAIDTLVTRLAAHPGAAVAGPRLVGADGRVELSFGPMISPFGELRQKTLGALYRAQGCPDRTLGRADDAQGAVRRLGQRSVFAGFAGRCGSRRSARRAFLSVYGRRRFLRVAAGPWPTDPLRAGG